MGDERPDSVSTPGTVDAELADAAAPAASVDAHLRNAGVADCSDEAFRMCLAERGTSRNDAMVAVWNVVASGTVDHSLVRCQSTQRALEAIPVRKLLGIFLLTGGSEIPS